MNRVGFLLLSILKTEAAETRTSAMTLREMMEKEDLGCKENTAYKYVKSFERSGLVERGLKDGRSQTYYLTLAGAGKLEEIRERSQAAVCGGISMKMTEQEYRELIAHFEFLEDKVEKCYKRETTEVLKRLKKEYSTKIVNY